MSRYAGHVTSGGPSEVRELRDLVIRKCSVGEFDNNAYLLTCRATGEQLLIDAAADAPRLQAFVAEGTGALSGIVTTHRHSDHVRALVELAAWSGASTASGADDAAALPLAPDRALVHGDRLVIGAVGLDVVHLRGHTEGGVALVYADPAGFTHLFTGDSLFPGGAGRVTTPEDFDSLMTDLERRIFDVYPDDTVVHPGHGKPTTLGAERPHLPEWWARRW